MTLRVTLEIVPFGDEDKKYKIGELDISNFGNGKNTPGVFDYMFRFDKKEYEKVLVTHVRNDGAWTLVKKVLERVDTDGI